MLESIRTVARRLGVHHPLGLANPPAVSHHPAAVVAPDVGAGGGVSPGHPALPTEDNHYWSEAVTPTSPGVVREPVYPARLELIFPSFLPHEIVQVVRRAVQEDEEAAVLLDHSQRPEVN